MAKKPAALKFQIERQRNCDTVTFVVDKKLSGRGRIYYRVSFES
jgi:hypothetical protein